MRKSMAPTFANDLGLSARYYVVASSTSAMAAGNHIYHKKA